jgi:hypothetical protein
MSKVLSIPTAETKIAQKIRSTHAEPVQKKRTNWNPFAAWERWPWSFFYMPLTFVWAWFCLRSRSFWFFSTSNPTLTFGGFEGEGKREMYDQLPDGTFPTTVSIFPSETIDTVFQRIKNAGLRYPFIVKPEVGMKGLLCRKIESDRQMADYHQLCPVEYMAQELADYPMEIGVFYYRHPASKTGTVTGLTHKEPPTITGDGYSTLEEHMRSHPRAEYWLDEMLERHRSRLHWVLGAGEKFVLSLTANRNRGAYLHNLNHLIDQELTAFFDKISLHGPGQFYYGRYDIKCTSVEDLKQGKNFLILEFNGCGAAPNHVYHNGLSVWQAWAEIIRHWQILFEISRYNRKNGVHCWTFMEGFRFFQAGKRHFKLLELYDRKD